MSERQKLKNETPPSDCIDLSHAQSVNNIDNIPELGLKPNTWRFVPQGKMIEVSASGDIKHVLSDGFGKCSALIIHDFENNNYTFAHLQPMDDELYARLQAQERGQSDVVIVSGTYSSNQYDIIRLLSAQDIDVRTIQVETGDTPFGVSLNIDDGAISVVRAQPTRSLLIYNDLLAATEK